MANGDNATSAKLGHLNSTVSGIELTSYRILHHAFATRIHQADSVAPTPVSHVEARWKPGDTFSIRRT